MSKELDPSCPCNHDEIDTVVCARLNGSGVLTGTCQYQEVDESAVESPSVPEYPEIKTKIISRGTIITTGDRVVKVAPVNSAYL